jgi:hypothetical protein
MTKTDVLAGGGRRNHVADLDIPVRDDHAIDEQFNQLAFVFERGVVEVALEALAEVRDGLREPSQVESALRIGLEVVHLAFHSLHLVL